MLLIPLASTSTSGWIRRLGGRRWNRLHQLIYLAAIARVIHYYWLVKADVRKPLQYAVVLGYRLVISVFRNPRQTTMPDSRAPACKSLASCPPSMRSALPVTTPSIRGEMLAGTKSQVASCEAEPIQRALRCSPRTCASLLTFRATQAILKNEAAELITPPPFGRALER